MVDTCIYIYRTFMLSMSNKIFREYAYITCYEEVDKRAVNHSGACPQIMCNLILVTKYT